MIVNALPYPAIQHFNDVPAIKDVLCYFIKPYAMSGLSVVVVRGQDGFSIRISDFQGKIINPDIQPRSNAITTILTRYIPPITAVMKHARIVQAQYYFGGGDCLIDMRVSANKFVGPGMLRDLFGKLMPTQETIKIARASHAETANLKAILKPSAYKTIVRGNDVGPMYCSI
jgi:hypothetical protein